MTDKRFKVTSGLGEPVEFGEPDLEDDAYLHVDVAGMGLILIKADIEGIVVDVYPEDEEEPVAGCWATKGELEAPE